MPPEVYRADQHPWVDFEKHFAGKWPKHDVFPFATRVIVPGRIGPRRFPEEILLLGSRTADDVIDNKPLKVGPHGDLFFMFPEHRLAPFEQRQFMHTLARHADVGKVKRVEIVTNSPLIVGDFLRDHIRIVSIVGE